MNTTQSAKNKLKTVWNTFVSNSNWRLFQKLIILIVFSLVVNHLTTRDNFPDSESYRFPIEGFLASIGLGIFIAIIAELNFRFYKKKYFSKKVVTVTIAWYMASTLAYITILYIPVCLFIDIVLGGFTEFYYILIGLLITLLLSFIVIGLFYAHDIYNLYKLSIKNAEITIESGAKLKKLTYENIACFYSENKIVYTVQNDGTTITTDFTLNGLEEKINDQLFFRANRQIIIHVNSIDEVEKIENGKLLLTLKPSITNAEISEINISRYKRKAFMNWFQEKA